MVDVGKLDDDKWVAQYSIRTDIDDYDICSMIFNKKPSKEDIIIAHLVDEIETYFCICGYDKVTFTCWECGCKYHWLDIPGSLKEKWECYKERYCNQC